MRRRRRRKKNMDVSEAATPTRVQPVFQIILKKNGLRSGKVQLTLKWIK